MTSFEAVAEAHQKAIAERSTIRLRMRDEMREAEEKAYEPVDRKAAEVMKEALENGLSRTEIRKALRTQQPEMFNRYFRFIDGVNENPSIEERF